MNFNTEEDNALQIRAVIQADLPEENEVIITSEGLIVLDEEGLLGSEEIGEETSISIICGC